MPLTTDTGSSTRRATQAGRRLDRKLHDDMKTDDKARTQPVVAACAGHYTEAAPQAALGAHFRCIWNHVLPQAHAGAVAVVPDGCVDLLWCNDRLIVVGPDIVAARPDLKPGETVIGARFQPGAAFHWLGLSMSEIIGSAVDMRDIWGQKARDLAERMQQARGIPAQTALLQHLLTQMASSFEPSPSDGAAIFATLENDGGSEGGAIARLTERLDVSERTLRRRSRHLFGYGPKTLDRILRFQRFQSLARNPGGSGMAEMAYATGYADQAHLNREIRALCGMTSGEFVRQFAA